MNSTKYFNWEWRDVGGQRVLYASPKKMSDDGRWIEFFEDVSEGYEASSCAVIIDVRKKEERVGLAGFMGILGALKNRGVTSVAFAVLSFDVGHGTLAKLFESAAEHLDLDVKIDVFTQEDTAEKWFSQG